MLHELFTFLNYENWSREIGCVEFASDCDLDNEISLNFHPGIGFKELHRIIHFIPIPNKNLYNKEKIK